MYLVGVFILFTLLFFATVFWISFPTWPATVAAKSLTITGASAQNKSYDGTTTATISGITLNGVVGSDDVSATGGGTFADKNVGAAIAVTSSLTLTGTKAGNYILAAQPSGLSADNYYVINQEGTLTINPSPIYIQTQLYTKIYDGTTYIDNTNLSSNIIEMRFVGLLQCAKFITKNKKNYLDDIQ